MSSVLRTMTTAKHGKTLLVLNMKRIQIPYIKNQNGVVVGWTVLSVENSIKYLKEQEVKE